MFLSSFIRGQQGGMGMALLAASASLTTAAAKFIKVQDDLCCVRYRSDYSNHIQGKYMQKFLNKRGAKSKRKWYQPHFAEPLESIGKAKQNTGSQKTGVTEVQRTRARQLGHVLYDKITQIISTGELSQELQDLQVFITEVRMHPNFGGINVHWEADRADADEAEMLLQSHAGKLRSLLISYHVLGKIPPITFVRCKSKNYTGDLERLFQVADYGPDYVSSYSVERMHKNDNETDKASPSSFSRDVEAKFSGFHISQKPDSSEGSVWTSSGSGMHDLEFRNDLYGLPVDDLMNKIRAKKERAQASKEDMASVFESLSEESRARSLSFIGRSSAKVRYNEKGSVKAKQKMLQMDPEDFREMQGGVDVEEDFYNEEEDEDYDKNNENNHDK